MEIEPKQIADIARLYSLIGHYQWRIRAVEEEGPNGISIAQEAERRLVSLREKYLEIVPPAVQSFMPFDNANVLDVDVIWEQARKYAQQAREIESQDLESRSDRSNS